MSNFQNLIWKMETILAGAQKLRENKNKQVPTNDPRQTGLELEWIVYERQVMFDAVVVERMARRLPEITMSDYVKIENMAVGHSDYTHKLAIYCAELSLKIDPKINP